MKGFKFIGCLVLFLVLMGISCWATEKSLAMLLPQTWPGVFVWLITIAFFVMASLGSAWLVQSLGSSQFVDNRKLKLWGGLALVVVFWLLVSMPTNTHTFYYDNNIGHVINSDIDKTNKYLSQIIDKTNHVETTYDAEALRTQNEVYQLQTQLEQEFIGTGESGRSGNGEKCQGFIRQINEKLNSNIPININRYSTDPDILAEYKAGIDKALAKYMSGHVVVTEETQQNAQKIHDQLNELKDKLSSAIQTNSLNQEQIKQVESVLQDGYNIIAHNSKYVNFDNKDDEELYTADPAHSETRTKRLSSVFKTFFSDFLGGRMPATFLYWMLISILIDVAAFIFFDMLYSNFTNKSI